MSIMKIIQTIFILSLAMISHSQIKLNGNNSIENFWNLKGKLIIHPIIDKSDSNSDKEIHELQDENGLPIWFKRYIFKDVCLKGQCKMIKLWMYWDGSGNYSGIQLLENEPLTKSDHTKFESEDYKKLNDILRDTASILKSYMTEDLTIATNNNLTNEVDAISSATQPSLQSVTVKNAVYTCHTLWHTVYGPTYYAAIQQILNERTDKEYLALLFSSHKTAYQSWAINFIEQNPYYHNEFSPLIAGLISSNNALLSRQAIEYFQPEKLNDLATQRVLAAVIPEVNQQFRYDIIWKYAACEKIDIEVVINLLDYFDRQMLGINSLGLIYKLLKPDYLKEKRVIHILCKLKNNENVYVQNLTKNLIHKN